MDPIRCWTCGSVVANKIEEFRRRVEVEAYTPDAVLAKMEIKRLCCRRFFLADIDRSEVYARHSEIVDPPTKTNRSTAPAVNATVTEHHAHSSSCYAPTSS